MFDGIIEEDFHLLMNFLKRKNFEIDGGLYVLPFKVDSIPGFFKTEEFDLNLQKLKEEYDFVICDTPPWSLFVDAKIISQKFGHIIYVAGSEIATFKDIETFEAETEEETISYFLINLTISTIY